MVLSIAIAVLAARYQEWYLVIAAIGAFVLLFLLFRDPHRDVPPMALGIVSPVDGKVVDVATTSECVVQGEAYRIKIRVNAFGAYTARSPVEGRIMDLQSKLDGVGPGCPANALWVETDEGSSVVLRFLEYRLGIAPRSFVNLGERLGLGQRCAYIRLARFAEVYLPINGKVHVQVGQKVKAGADLIGAVPHP